MTNRIILIGNYPRDNQESMERFALMLEHGFRRAGIETEIWRPLVFFGRYVTTTAGIGKWIGYLDKWVLFPLVLSWRLQKKKYKTSEVRFHVCDHSNSPYLKHLPRERTIITCHDALAIRGAFGYADAYCPASPAGVILQKWILRRLQKARSLITTTQLTLDQLTDLSKGVSIDRNNWHVVPLAFNADFKRIDKQQRDRLLDEVGLHSETSFLLHVGSALPRKNRKLLIDMMVVLDSKWQGMVCYAGEPLENEVLEYAASKGVEKRIVSVVKPGHQLLEALYNACEAFIFPSFSEGFGWPPIEAQACGAPVIASNFPPMPEVSGGAALHADPYKPAEFAEAFLTIKNSRPLRDEIIRKGTQNVERFKPDRMINEYLVLHGLKRN